MSLVERMKMRDIAKNIESKIKEVNPLLTADQMAGRLIEDIQDELIVFKFNPEEYNFFLTKHLRPNLGE